MFLGKHILLTECFYSSHYSIYLVWVVVLTMSSRPLSEVGTVNSQVVNVHRMQQDMKTQCSTVDSYLCHHHCSRNVFSVNVNCLSLFAFYACQNVVLI